MGTWGPGIFSDDEALDVKDYYIFLGRLFEKELPYPRVALVAKGVKEKSDYILWSGYIFRWKQLDSFLKDRMGIS